MDNPRMISKAKTENYDAIFHLKGFEVRFLFTEKGLSAVEFGDGANEGLTPQEEGLLMELLGKITLDG